MDYSKYSLLVKPFQTLDEITDRENYWDQLQLATLSITSNLNLVKDIGGYWKGPPNVKLVFGNYQANKTASYILFINSNEQVESFTLDPENPGTFTTGLEEIITLQLLSNIDKAELDAIKIESDALREQLVVTQWTTLS